jgi:O-methyltransferase
LNHKLKNLLRPIYRSVVTLPLVRQALDRQIAQSLEAYIVRDFVTGSYGEAYGVNKRARLKLVECFERNNQEIQSGTSRVIHTVLSREILSIPPHVKGDVIECGVWKGASTASLSLVCRIVGRRLLVCDSFEGLPDDGLKPHVAPHFGIYGYYRQGMFCGRLEEVRGNVHAFGDLEMCDFVPGFFSSSLYSLPSPLVFAFLDVDLVSSTQDCLRHIWPRLVEGGTIYTDDAGDMDVVRVFFDEVWWQQNLKCAAPGYVGSGCGLPLNPRYSSLGYTRRRSHFRASEWQKAAHLYYPDIPNEVPES